MISRNLVRRHFWKREISVWFAAIKKAIRWLVEMIYPRERTRSVVLVSLTFSRNIAYKFDLDSFLKIICLITVPAARILELRFHNPKNKFPTKENARVNGEKGAKRRFYYEIIKNVIIYITTGNEGFNEKDKRRERAVKRSEENCSDVRNKKLMNTARLIGRCNAFLIDYLIRSSVPVT